MLESKEACHASHCSPERQVALLRMILGVHRRGRELLQAGVPLARLRAAPALALLPRAKSTYGDGELDGLLRLEARVRDELEALWPAST